MLNKMTKICTKCKEDKPKADFYRDKSKKDGLCSSCKDCYYILSKRQVMVCTQKEYKIKYREENREKIRAYYNLPENKLKQVARNIFNKALYRGKIKRQPCEVCVELKVEGHHEDYTKPLKVNWLCTKHHIELHKLLRNN